MKKFFGFLMLIITVVMVCQQMCKKTTTTPPDPWVIGTSIASAVLGNFVRLQKAASVLGITSKVVQWHYYNENEHGAVVEMDDGTEEYIDVAQYRAKHPEIDSEKKLQRQQKILQKDFDECTRQVSKSGASGAQKREKRVSCLEDRGHDRNDLLLYRYHGWYEEESI